MASGICCSPQSFCPDVYASWNNFEREVLYPTVKKTVHLFSSVFYNLSLRSSFNRVFPFAIDTVKMFAPSYVSPALEGLKGVFAASDTVMDGFTPLMLVSYFIGKREEKLQKIVEINGEPYIVDPDLDRKPLPGETGFTYQLRTRPFAAYANLSIFITGLFLSANLLNATKLLTYADIASKFAKVPYVGEAISMIFTGTVIGATINTGLGIYYFFNALDNVRYIGEASVDRLKDPTKGWLLLAANVSNVALQVMVLAGTVSTPFGLGATALLLVAQLYKESRSYDKEAALTANLAALKNEFPRTA